MHTNQSGKVGVTCILATVASVGILYTIYKVISSKNRQLKVPAKWRAVGKLKSLYMYPLKSGHRYEVHEADCTASGLHKNVDGFDWGDRSFLVYDPDTMQYKTATQYPVMVLININPRSPGKFGISTPDLEEIEIDLPWLDIETKRILSSETELINCWDCGDDAAKFVSEAILKRPSGLRLSYHYGRFKTETEHAGNDDPNRIDEIEKLEGTCSDLTAYHLVSKTSVDKLNKELTQPVTEHYFRPNFYVFGHHLKAWEEESWEWIKIGGAIFRNLKPCVRCTVSTVDPKTGVKNENGEPFKTLEKVALLKDKKMAHIGVSSPVMGIHLGLYREGKVHVHDQVYVA